MPEFRPGRFVVVTLVLSGLYCVSDVSAQLPPRTGYVYPPGGRAGTTVEVHLGGFDFTDDMQFFVHHEGLNWEVHGRLGAFLVPPPPYWFGPKGRSSAMPIPRELAARIHLPADLPPGPIYWQVANANGISSTAIFMVSDQEEILEDRYRQNPQRLEVLPAVVSGRLLKIAEVDRYQFTVDQDDLVSLDLQARRIGSNFHGVLTVFDQDGKRIADVADTEGLDVDLTFRAQAGETYTAELHDLDFRGNRAYVYRLGFHRGPRVVAMIPAAAQRGKNQRLEFSGIGLVSGEKQRESVQADVAGQVSTKAASFIYPLQTSRGVVPVVLPLSDVSEQRESELAKNASGCYSLQIPGAVTGDFSGDGMERRFELTARKETFLTVAVESRALGSGFDVSLVVLDAAGKEVAKNDDAGGTTDVQLDWQPPEDGVYTLVIRGLPSSRARRSGVYRLHVQERQPGFQVNGPQLLTLPIAGKAELKLKVVRYGGFKGTVTVQIDGLPAGVSVPESLIIKPDQAELKIPFEAAADMGCVASVIQVSGLAMIGDKPVSVLLQTPAAGNLCPQRPDANKVNGILLATTMKAPFEINLIGKNRQRAVHRGTTYPAPLEIKREADFKGEVILQMAANQSRHRQGISGPRMTVPANQSRVFYPCFMPEWLETDRTTRMTIMGFAWIPDPQGKPRAVTKATNANVTMILEGALLKVTPQRRMLMLQPGQSQQIPVRVFRSAKLPVPVQLELIAPPDIGSRVKADPVTVPVGTEEVVLKLQSSASADWTGDHPLRIRATALQDGKWPAISEADLPLRVLPVAVGTSVK
ncbi:MAG: hypothetical protein CMJ70_21465 [Planctomycetaceae bacterium]|nr:hypothetical protein [Planctomycetaceae bacterium]|tara:strand:+ start:914 stop:3346 length:2433 start_codon:yes stop_codon:yes gene_type:complete